METILTQYYQSPYGELLLGSFGDKLCLCDWMLNEKRRVTVDKRIRQALHADYEEGTSEVIARAIIQLDEYFACKRTIFDVPLLAVGTEFQRTVWQELQNIPYGKTVSYGELSRKLGNPKSRTCGGGCQWGKCPLHTHPLPSCGGQQPYADRLCRWTGSQTRDAGIGSGLLRRTVRLPYRTAVLRSGLFLVFRRCHPRHTFEELREERRIGKVQFV